MNELHLFVGGGFGVLGGILCGHTCVCAVEIEPYRRKLLLQRQRDEVLPRFPIWDNITTFDGKPWRGKVDIICAGIPCQKVSSAGLGGGFLDQDYYQAFRRTVCEVEPQYVLLENSPMLTSRGLGHVLGDMAAMGYDARWSVLGASDAGFNHRRKRIWVLFADSKRSQWRQESHRWSIGRMGREFKPMEKNRDWKDALTEFRRMDDGCANIVDRTDTIRNGQVPAVVKLAWETLSQ